MLASVWRMGEDHSKGPAIGTRWDADRLDLERVGIKPHPGLLNTELARELATSPNVAAAIDEHLRTLGCHR